MTLENQPAEGAALCFHDTTNLHRTRENHGRDEAEAQRHLVRNHLHRATHGRNNAILIIRAPSCDEYSNNADTRNGRHQEDADVEIQNCSTLVPWHERERTYRTNQHQYGSDGVEQFISFVNSEDFFDKHLQNVGNNLENTPWTNTHRAETALESCAHLAFHEDQQDSQYGVGSQYEYTHEHTFDEYGPKAAQSACVSQQTVKPRRND